MAKVEPPGCWHVIFYTLFVGAVSWILGFGLTMGWGAARMLLGKWGI